MKMKLSIITINYNNCAGLQKTIDSVIAQTWRDFEWIIIDGGSTDGSKELIEKYQDYFSYWCSEPDKGVYNAMNKGIAIANGEYLNFMNSGDCYTSDDVLKNVFEKANNSDVIFGNWVSVYKDKEQLSDSSKLDVPFILIYHNICHQAMFFRTSLLKYKGYDESYKICADWARNVELSLQGISFKYVSVTVCRYDMNGISNINDNLRINEEDRVKSIFPLWILDKIEALNDYEHNKDIQAAKELFRSNILFRYPAEFFIRSLIRIKHLF